MRQKIRRIALEPDSPLAIMTPAMISAPRNIITAPAVLAAADKASFDRFFKCSLFLSR